MGSGGIIFLGLYRYCVGDVLKVKGFRKTTPIFEYIRRQNVVLSIASEKTDEAELNSVVHKAARQLEGTGTELAEFSSMADMLASPAPCYVLFWEITARNGLDLISQISSIWVCFVHVVGCFFVAKLVC